jgi:hypothetical protein
MMKVRKTRRLSYSVNFSLKTHKLEKMLYPSSWKDKTLAFLVTTVLLTTVAKATERTEGSLSKGQTLDLSGKRVFSGESVFRTIAGDFLHSSSRNSHISGISSLYIIDKDTGWLSPVDERMSSKYVRKEKNSDLAIVVPAPRGKYKIRFFDDKDQFLFGIRQIRDSLLIVEKVNFRHAGLFQYELYKDNALVERNRFIIKSNP